MSNGFDRSVGVILGGTVVACLIAASLVRPVPFAAAAAAHWSTIASRLAAGDRVPPALTVDGIAADTARLDVARVPTLPRGTVLRVQGWTLDPAGVRSSGGVRYQLDGGAWRDARDHLARPEIAAALRLDDPNVGYALDVQTTELAAGIHRLTIGSGAGGSWTMPAQTIRFAVTPR